jgi:hypothetical protein
MQVMGQVPSKENIMLKQISPKENFYQLISRKE